MEFFSSGFGLFVLILAQCLAVTIVVLVSLAFLMYADRKIWAAVQLRRGPNVVGPWGLLQSFADFLKYIVKEIVVPAGADKAVFFLAPMISFVLPMIVWAVIPWAPGWVISDMNVGILFIFAISSLHVYAIIMGGWASNSKYPFLGGLRSAAQMISYEVSIGFIIVGDPDLDRLAEPQPHRAGAGRRLGPLQLVLAAAPADGGAVLHLGARRDQPPAVRPAGGRVRARRRLPGRVLVDAVPPVHDRRADERLLHVRADLGALLRRLAVAGARSCPTARSGCS